MRLDTYFLLSEALYMVIMKYLRILQIMLLAATFMFTFGGPAFAEKTPEFPRILIHNFIADLGVNNTVSLSDNIIDGLAKRDLIVMASCFANDVNVIGKIRAKNPSIKILMYATLDSAVYADMLYSRKGLTHAHPPAGIGNKDEAKIFIQHPETWLYEVPNGILLNKMGQKDVLAVVQGIDQKRINELFESEGKAGHWPLFVIGEEIVRVENADGNNYTIRRGQCGGPATEHKVGSTVRVVNTCAWSGG